MAALRLINRYANVLIGAAEARGFDRAAIGRVVDLTPDTVLAGQPAYGPRSLALISRNIKLLMGDEFCGLTQSRCKVGSFIMMGELAVLSSSLGDGLKRAFSFYDLVSDDLAFRLVQNGDRATIEMRLTHPEMDRFNFLYEWWFVVWTNFASWLIGEEIPWLSVEFPHARTEDLEEYAQSLGLACHFGRPVASLTLPSRFLAARITKRLPDFEQFHNTQSIDFQGVPGTRRSMKSLLTAALRDHLHETERFLTMEEISERFNMCSQTLRRRLEEEGTSYRALKEEVRREAIMTWLRDVDVPIGEISLLAGFAEPNGLFRAVKLWTGMSPSEYRTQIMRESLAERGAPVVALSRSLSDIGPYDRRLAS
ncbi:MAG: AraC family transcriptional regulator ligand-binding domain-containing protein [Aliidongia sp.]